MQYRIWNIEEDYSTLVKWWKDWKFGIVPKECLPPDGIIVEYEDFGFYEEEPKVLFRNI